MVSIHASSREDATHFPNLQLIATGFNPRVLAGGRDPRTVILYELQKFQSTRPRGRTRPSTPCWEVLLHSFNPRVLAGGRDMRFTSTFSCGIPVSIHASSREDAT